MKERFFIKGNIADKITYYHLVAFVISLPFNRIYSELALASLLVHTLVNLRKENFRQVRWKEVLIPASIYLLTLLATVYTKYTDNAFSEWERQAALLLFPLIIALNAFDFRRYILNIVLAMAFSCAFTVLCLYGAAFRAIVVHQLPLVSIFRNAFLNHNFSARIDMHATYFSMYIALAAAAAVYAFFKTETKRNKYLYAFLGIVLMAGLIQLSSRAVLISFALIMNMLVPTFWIEKTKRSVYMILSLVITVSVLFFFTRNDSLKTRFIVGMKEELTQNDAINNLLEPRALRWSSAKQLMLGSPVYGYGSGSEIPLLKEVYYEHQLYNSYLNSLNIHNQYLSMFIKTGALGLLLLLFVLFAGFRRAIQSKDGLFCAFLIIVTTVFFSENVLDGNKGIFFFAFFYSLFYIRRKEAELIQK
jgi:O-antigen ligase